jgi:hypothetical protein
MVQEREELMWIVHFLIVLMLFSVVINKCMYINLVFDFVSWLNS